MMSDHGEGSEIALLKAENARLRKIILEATNAFHVIIHARTVNATDEMRQLYYRYVHDEKWFLQRNPRQAVSFEAWIADKWLDENGVKGGT